MRTLRAVATLAILLLAALPAQAADPAKLSWSPHNPAAAVTDLALAAEGPVLVAPLGAPFPQPAPSAAIPNTNPPDLFVYDVDGGVAYEGDDSRNAGNPLGRTHAAVNRTGEVVATLGQDVSTVSASPTTPFLELTYLRVPPGRWSGATPLEVSQPLGAGATGVGLAVSADGNRVVVAGNSGANYFVRGYTFASGGLTRAFDVTAAGTVVALGASGTLDTVVATIRLNESGELHPAVLLIPFDDGRAVHTFHERTLGNVTLGAVAVARDGARFAVGGPNGTLLTFENRGALTPEPVRTAVGADAVANLAISGDGRRLLASSGTALQLFEFLQATPRALWSYTASGNVTSVAANFTGGLLVAGVQSGGVVGFADVEAAPLWTVAGDARHVVLNDAGTTIAYAVVASGGQATVHALAVTRAFVFEFPGGSKTGPVGTATPQAPARFELILRNQGAAPETFVFEPSGGAAVDVTTDPASPTLRPGEVRRITVNATPDTGTPGDTTFNLTARALGTGAVENVTLTARLAPRVNVTLFYGEATELPASPGVPVSVRLGVRNDGNKDASVGIRATQSVTRGETWTLDVNPPSFNLAPATQTTVTVTLTPPLATPNGTANVVTFSLEGQDVSGTVAVTLRVNPSVSISVDAASRARFVEPGRNVTYNVTVLNNGTLPRLYELYADVTATGGKNWVADVTAEPFRLDAGANRTVQVRVYAPDDAVVSDRATIVVTGRTVPELANETPLTDNVTLFANAAPPVTPTPTQDDNGLGIPAPGLIPLTAALLMAALVLRRRRS